MQVTRQVLAQVVFPPILSAHFEQSRYRAGSTFSTKGCLVNHEMPVTDSRYVKAQRQYITHKIGNVRNIHQFLHDYSSSKKSPEYFIKS